MAVFTRVKTWVSNEVLTASDLNGEFNNLLNNTIPASIEDYSADVSTMQSTTDPGNVGTESLATTLAGEITRLRFVFKRLINGAYWYSTPSIPKSYLAALGQQVSSGSGGFSDSSGASVDVTNLTVTITTTGRPVFIGFIPDTAVGASELYMSRSTSIMGFDLGLIRTGTSSANQFISYSISIGGASSVSKHLTTPYFLDVVAAGTYTYKITVDGNYSTSSPLVGFFNFKLIAYEL